MYLIPDQEDLPPVHSLLFSVTSDNASSNTRSYDKEVIRTLPFKDFAYESSRHRLLYMKLPDMPSGLSDEARYVYMASLVDFNSIAMGILMRMSKAAATVNEWKAFYKTFVNVIGIIGICHSCLSSDGSIDILVKMTSLQIEDLLRITALIKKTALDIVRCCVAVCVRLREKRVYNGLPDLLTRIAYGELEKLDPEITDCQVVYLPQIGYLLTIAQNAPGTDKPGLQFMFSCDNKSYFKTGTMKNRETEIMHKVQNMILEVAEAFLEAVSACGELDALLSLALVAREHNYVRPILTSETAIVITNGRHPLVESAGSSFVPNTFSSGGPHSKIKIITGPNNCGKSIYLKQVALIVYMAHIGSFVPAESAQIGAVDAILTCMYSEESLLHGLSSFAMQLNQANGIGLVVGTIESFVADPATCPHTLLATHFHTVHDHLPATPHITYLTFESLRHEGELVYLYQLREGRACSSYASLVGQAAGLSNDIVRRQQQITQAFSSKRKLLPQPMTRKEFVWNKALPLIQMLLDADLPTSGSAEDLLQNMAAALK
ncbi:hypothetical protein HPB50_011104 [Hyalomma asiaticum]|uniref:Uncharacterized protein n=1 Tax=Hyalomma asiaticum TaxID=266040 RepID=A0ACB7T203_HYAAI|nr:hypothetical protein HPB50_011104 [Hyalomma asiaticum]